MRAECLRTCVLLVLCCVVSTDEVAAGPMFTGMGDLPGGLIGSVANGVSADGSTVVGFSYVFGGYHAFRWKRDGGMVDLGTLPGHSNSSAAGVSADGLTIAGTSYGSTTQNAQAFHWTSGEGMIGLDVLPEGGNRSEAFDVSDDGSTIVGSIGLASGAFRWTKSDGMVGLSDPTSSFVDLRALAVCADGSAVVGMGNSGSATEAFLWTSSGGMNPLGDLPGGDAYSFAWGVSADGSTVVGTGASDLSAIMAFRWTSSDGMVELGDLPGGGIRSEALDVSADGSTVVGYSFAASNNRAFVWDTSHGMRALDMVLSDLGLGLALTGWTLTQATAISDDGLTIVGTGVNASGQPEAWIAFIPEPGTGLLVIAGLLGLVVRRRERA